MHTQLMMSLSVCKTIPSTQKVEQIHILRLPRKTSHGMFALHAIGALSVGDMYNIS
jgi:hypothetical protein